MGSRLTSFTSVKIVKSTLVMAVDEEFADLSIEEIAEGTFTFGGGVACGQWFILTSGHRASRELTSLCPPVS